MEKLRLKNEDNKSKQPTDIASYKKQWNLVVSINLQFKGYKTFLETMQTIFL